MIRSLKYIIGIVLILCLFAHTWKHWDSLRHLLRLSAGSLSLIYFISMVGLLNRTYVIHRLLLIFNVKTRFWDMVLLQNAIYLLDYAPMKLGTAFRANYLKRHYGLLYSQFSALFIYLIVLTVATASLLSIIVLLFVYDISRYEIRVLLVVFSVTLIVSLLLAFVPLPLPSTTSKPTKILKSFVDARYQLSRSKRILVKCAFLLMCNFLIGSLRLGIVYHNLNQQFHLTDYLVLGALGHIALFLSLTPGSLGVRELVMSAGATTLGVPLEVGILASLVERAIILSWAVVFGTISLFCLYRKSPADFKKAEPVQPVG